MDASRLRIEMVDEQMASVLRRKTGAERLKIANGLFRMARRLIRSRVKSEHSDWTDLQVDAEVARRILHGTT